jgi:hypothetical protein
MVIWVIVVHYAEFNIVAIRLKSKMVCVPYNIGTPNPCAVCFVSALPLGESPDIPVYLMVGVKVYAELEPHAIRR